MKAILLLLSVYAGLGHCIRIGDAAGVEVDQHTDSYNRSITQYGRDVDDDGSDQSVQIYDPSELFRKFREDMGEDKFNQLLHLRRQVTMAFVIDTSSSMANDMDHVRRYIRSLLVEQDRSGVSAVYLVCTFADPEIAAPKEFRNRQKLLEYLDTIETSGGGDCEERICFGMLRAMYENKFIRRGNAAMYVFTDASSKECHQLSFNIIRVFQFCKASAFFILFDSCRKNIDPHYVRIAQRTGGLCLLALGMNVYNITDIVNGAFDERNLVVGEHDSVTYQCNEIYDHDPSDIFKKFREDMGVRNFNELLHLRRSVTMAFVIDTTIDMDHVRRYIRSLLVEQDRSGVSAVYLVTFADQEIGDPQVFKNSQAVDEYLDTIETRARDGGDNGEKICLGMLKATYTNTFIRRGNAAMYVFTDASSKDCVRLAPNIIRSFQFCKASAFFILFDGCQKNIDPYYVQIAQRTGGFCLLVGGQGVYNVTDSLLGAFDSSNLVVGEHINEDNISSGQDYGPHASVIQSRYKILSNQQKRSLDAAQSVEIESFINASTTD